jgi:glycosyltransferase involved in cell wall biosynthesis
MGTPVVFVTGTNPTHGKGGGSAYVRSHMRAALRAGYEPHVFCIDSESGMRDESFGAVHRIVPALPFRRALAATAAGKRQGFLGHWFGGFAFSPYNSVSHGPRLAAAIERFLAGRAGPHLVHGFYTWGCVGIEVRARLRRGGADCTVVNSIYTTARHEAEGKARGAAGVRPLQRALFRAERLWIDSVVRSQERRVYRDSRLVLVNYAAVRRQLLAEHGPGAETRMAPYCAEAAFLDAASAADGPPPGDPLIVSVSRHDPRKGVDVLIRALAMLRDRGVRFRACLVSGGALLASHRRMAAALRLTEMTTLTGWVDDARPYFRRAGIFVLPSLQEGSGSLSLLEAMQAGAAIVASNVDGIPEDVADGESALLVEPGDADALSRAIEHVLGSAALRQRLGCAARAAQAARFSPDAFAGALGAVYAGLGHEIR